MTCSECKELFSEYLDGQLHGSSRKEFESHADSCVSCAPKLRQARHLRMRLGRLTNKRLPDEFSFKMRRALAEAAEREHSPARRLGAAVRPRPETAWAAAVGTMAAAISIAVFWVAWTPLPAAQSPMAMYSPAVAEAQTPLASFEASDPPLVGDGPASHRRAVRYVLDNIPLGGVPIESTARDTMSVARSQSGAARSSAIKQVAARSVSASF
jgi:hypothetical protein